MVTGHPTDDPFADSPDPHRLMARHLSVLVAGALPGGRGSAVASIYADTRAAATLISCFWSCNDTCGEDMWKAQLASGPGQPAPAGHSVASRMEGDDVRHIGKTGNKASGSTSSPSTTTAAAAVAAAGAASPASAANQFIDAVSGRKTADGSGRSILGRLAFWSWGESKGGLSARLAVFNRDVVPLMERHAYYRQRQQWTGEPVDRFWVLDLPALIIYLVWVFTLPPAPTLPSLGMRHCQLALALFPHSHALRLLRILTVFTLPAIETAAPLPPVTPLVLMEAEQRQMAEAPAASDRAGKEAVPGALQGAEGDGQRKKEERNADRVRESKKEVTAPVAMKPGGLPVVPEQQSADPLRPLQQQVVAEAEALAHAALLPSDASPHLIYRLQLMLVRNVQLLVDRVESHMLRRVLTSMQAKLGRGEYMDVVVRAVEARRMFIRREVVTSMQRAFRSEEMRGRSRDFLHANLEQAIRNAAIAKFFPEAMTRKLVFTVGEAVFDSINDTLRGAMEGEGGRMALEGVVDSILDGVVESLGAKEVERLIQDVTVGVLDSTKAAMAAPPSPTSALLHHPD
eukprot:jgi/Mesvir1/18920/Mv18907-RA.2